jgi:hypothetical protein
MDTERLLTDTRSAAKVCVVEWITESTSSITEDVIGMLAPVQTPTKDRSDPSYLRPLVVSSH